MLMVARELFVCKCATNVQAPQGMENKLEWVRGGPEHLALLDPEAHHPQQVEDLRARLKRGEYWVLGLEGRRVVSYTWLHTNEIIDFPYLPGCTFRVAGDVGYGYDAWTQPSDRGRGLRREGFVAELRALAQMGKRWEASFFVKDQIDGARRSLATVGIEVVPLWRVRLGSNRNLAIERIAQGDDSALPIYGAERDQLMPRERSSFSS
jgi:hypothetical protein